MKHLIRLILGAPIVAIGIVITLTPSLYIYGEVIIVTTAALLVAYVLGQLIEETFWKQ